MSASPPTADPHSLLPAGLAAAVEAAASARIVGVRPRGGGGASRDGAELTLSFPDGRVVEAYMNHDVMKAGAGDDAAFSREAAILRELSGPLAGTGVRVARFIAAVPECRALVTERVAGEANFNAVTDPKRRTAIASDFMAQLAQLHAIDIERVGGLGRPLPAGEVALRRAAKNRTRGRGDDPLLHLALDWLVANVPAEPDRLVVVHGDAGPGNFLYDGERVTALLDWELVHLGDPMADLAMLCLRSLFQPLIALPQAFAAYEKAGGARVDLARVRYWRLLFQTGFAGRVQDGDPDAPPPPNLGMNMVYSTIHRRVLAEALAEATGIELTPVAMPDAPKGAHERSFQIALDDLRDVIVPRLSDQRAAVKAKGLARLVKWWRAIEQYGPAFETAERDELSAALGRRFASVEEGRRAFAAAVRAGELAQPTAIRLCHARVVREAALMADAMGALANTRFLPLE